MPLPPPIEHFKKATAVFSGKVIEIKKAKLNIGNGMFLQKRVKFDVAKSWKGVEKKTVLLFTGRGGGDCGYGFEKGESYLVYAFGKDSLSTSMMLLAKLNQAAKAEKRGVLVCEGVFSINQSMARVKFIAAAVKTC